MTARSSFILLAAVALGVAAPATAADLVRT